MLNRVVLSKQVPDTESLIGISADASDIKADSLKWTLDPLGGYRVAEDGFRQATDEVACEPAARALAASYRSR